MRLTEPEQTRAQAEWAVAVCDLMADRVVGTGNSMTNRAGRRDQTNRSGREHRARRRKQSNGSSSGRGKRIGIALEEGVGLTSLHSCQKKKTIGSH